MSHSLQPAKPVESHPSKTRVVQYLFVGEWSAEDERLMQRSIDEGTTTQVEMCRDGLWFSGPPGPAMRALCAELERRGLRRERELRGEGR